MADYLFGITWMTPLLFTIIVAFTTSFLSQLAFSVFTDKKFVNESKEKIKSMQKKLLSMKPSSDEYSKLQTEMLDLNMQLMSHTMKPTLITMVPFLILFMWVKSIIPVNQPLVKLPLSLPVVGNSFEFFGVYFITSFVSSWILRRLFQR